MCVAKVQLQFQWTSTTSALTHKQVTSSYELHMKESLHTHCSLRASGDLPVATSCRGNLIRHAGSLSAWLHPGAVRPGQSLERFLSYFIDCSLTMRGGREGGREGGGKSCWNRGTNWPVCLPIVVNMEKNRHHHMNSVYGVLLLY